MENKDVQPSSGKLGQGEDLEEEKIPLEIKDIIRIKPSAFPLFKKEFEKFILEWDKD